MKTIKTVDGVDYETVESIDPRSCNGCVADNDDALCTNLGGMCDDSIQKEVKIVKKEQNQLDPHLNSLLLAIVEGKQIQFNGGQKFIAIGIFDSFAVERVTRNPGMYRVKPDTVKLTYRLAIMGDCSGDYIATHQFHVHHNTQEEFATQPHFRYWLTETQEVEVEV
jgi:hypothetical protein